MQFHVPIILAWCASKRAINHFTQFYIPYSRICFSIDRDKKIFITQD